MCFVFVKTEIETLTSALNKSTLLADDDDDDDEKIRCNTRLLSIGFLYGSVFS